MAPGADLMWGKACLAASCLRLILYRPYYYSPSIGNLREAQRHRHEKPRQMVAKCASAVRGTVRHGERHGG